jgi:hypothetical protein
LQHFSCRHEDEVHHDHVNMTLRAATAAAAADASIA